MMTIMTIELMFGFVCGALFAITNVCALFYLQRIQTKEYKCREKTGGTRLGGYGYPRTDSTESQREAI
jgi:hypothetical protein